MLVRGLPEEISGLGLVALALVGQRNPVEGVGVLLVPLTQLLQRLAVLLFLKQDGANELVRLPDFPRVVLG